MSNLESEVKNFIHCMRLRGDAGLLMQATGDASVRPTVAASIFLFDQRIAFSAYSKRKV